MTEDRDDFIEYEDEDDGGTGCVCSATGGRWIRIDHSALYEKLINDLPPELRNAARKGRVALGLPSTRAPSKQEDQDV